ncbi:uncharacterized protein LOC133325908 isoform X2 [Musca vetustissima]|uniref:uncharacterized protein LOC133325908 isoform X2 n=1 Tax=Musca vetustissima TaxID=27455 RepID=UPI002AB729EE|nr:uncharacterized protein LOC133325908 isoform X2 [Musca vetustissima]
MNSRKLLKTTFQNKKEIVSVVFDGINDYDLFINKVKETYNIPSTEEVQIFNKKFLIKPNIFTDLVEQYLSSTDFILDVNLINDNSSYSTSDSNDELESQASSSQNIIFGSTQPQVIRTLTCITDDIFNQSQGNIFIDKNAYPSVPSTEEIKEYPEIKQLLQCNSLQNKDRTIIAKSIVSNFLSQNVNRRLYKDDLLQLSRSIIEVFPSEVGETYYVLLTKGKLFDAYNNKRTQLSAAGLINRRENLKKKSNHTQLSEDHETGISADELKILETTNVDWNKTRELWIKSHSYRQNELQNNELSTIDYIQKYNIHLNENFHELLQIDFKILYPNSKSIYQWKQFYEKLILKAEQSKENSVLQILANIDRTEDEDCKIALSLMIIPFILPHYRKNTKLESLESFIYYCKNIQVADDETRNRIKRLKKDTQPKIYFVGDTTKPISIAYVDICGNRLKFENPLKAVEACFYSFMSMNIKYPTACLHVWTFIQYIIYEINTPWDTTIPAFRRELFYVRLKK